MPKPKGKNRELFDATHQTVFEVATRLFSEHGFDAVTTKAIATEAGVAQGSVFHHFKTKRDLFIKVHNQYQLRLIERIDAAASKANGPEDRFDRIWRAYLSSTEDAGMRRILLLDGPQVIGLEALRAQDRETAFAFFMDELATLQNQGLIQPHSLRALAILLFGALDQAAFEIADFPEDLDLRHAIILETSNLIQRLKSGR